MIHFVFHISASLTNKRMNGGPKDVIFVFGGHRNEHESQNELEHGISAETFRNRVPTRWHTSTECGGRIAVSTAGAHLAVPMRTKNK